MNKAYCYEHFEEWNAEKKNGKPVAIEVLVKKLGELPEDRKGVDQNPAWQQDWGRAKLLPEYHYKAGCVNAPEVVEALKERGLHYESLEMGGIRWLAIAPQEALERRDRKLALLLVFHKENFEDPYWAMKTLEQFRDYNELAAVKRDRTILYLVSNNEPCRLFQGMITEGLQNYCGDRDRVYIDLSLLRQHQVKLKDIEDFTYRNLAGKGVESPDEAVEYLDDIPVLNFGWRWTTPWRGLPVGNASDGTIDREWLMHSGTGEKLLKQDRFMTRFQSIKEREVWAYWEKMGLRCQCHFSHEERWVIFTPAQSALDTLPVVVVLEEVNEPDDHSVIRAFGNYMTYGEIAAQGDCALIFFAMEHPRWNDWICDILREAAEKYPIDLSRVYLTGHSHNGHFVQEFARRHPKMVACIAPLGNSPGLPTPAYSHEAVAVDDEKAALMETMDMPTCILCGCKEVGCLVPVNRAGHAFEAGINVEGYAASAEGKVSMWNRRLRAERCKEQPFEAVMAAAGSAKKAERELGFPADDAETVYLDGLEHYIGDIRNVDGKFHFRVVAIENLSHMVSPSMNLMAWNYMRRFARDQATGEVVELGI